jgi:hypothetical protein
LATIANYAIIAFTSFHGTFSPSTGISLAAMGGTKILNCSFWGLDTSITGTTAYGTVCINGVFEDTTDAFKWTTTKEDINFLFSNHQGASVTRMYNSATNKVADTAPHVDPEVTTGAPGWTTTGNFSLTYGSPCVDVGMSASFFVGL